MKKFLSLTVLCASLITFNQQSFAQTYSNSNTPNLVCRGSAGYAAVLSQAAADSLIKAGYKNFKVQVSSTILGRDNPIDQPAGFSADSFKVSSEDLGCTTLKGVTECKVGARVEFVGQFPAALIPCSIDRLYEIRTTLPGNRVVVHTQEISVPGAYVYPLRKIKDLGNKSVAIK